MEKPGHLKPEAAAPDVKIGSPMNSGSIDIIANPVVKGTFSPAFTGGAMAITGLWCVISGQNNAYVKVQGYPDAMPNTWFANFSGKLNADLNARVLAILLDGTNAPVAFDLVTGITLMS